jgi:molecular chaperone DnaK (HSP70)
VRGRLAVDFGTSNTVLALWDEARREGVPLELQDFSRYFVHGGEPVPVIPSLIHYGPQGERWIGDQVLARNLYDSPHTFRWMKRYIANRSPVRVRVGEREITPFEAGRDFLFAVLAFARQVAGLEPSAAALGYGAHIQPGDVYLVFDFGAGTLDVAVVLIEAEEEAESGSRCRVLGKAGADLGGMTVDQWLFEEVLRRSHRREDDPEVRRVSRTLLSECERAKERLSFFERAGIYAVDPGTGTTIGGEFTRQEFEELLDRRGFFSTLDQTVRRALAASREKGYDEEHVKSVLLVGGSSLIPSVQRTLQRIFGRERVCLNRPLDAVARGAAAFAAGIDFYDHIQHDYAVRHYNRRTGQYEYRVVVTKGTPYPTKEPVARLTVKATHDGQTHLGIAIFEVSAHRRKRSAERVPEVELVFGPSGEARLISLTPEEEERRSYFWMNEKNPTFLRADPPAREGEARFEVEFSVDENKRLLLTARDLRTRRLVYRDYPVVRLT